MKNITLEEIIKRKLNYIKNHPTEEMADVDEGYIEGYTEMLNSLHLTEAEFIEKFKPAVEEHKRTVDEVMNGEIFVEDFGKKNGYNNAIIEILSLLNFDFLFERAE